MKEHFTRDELKCHCCGQCEMDTEFMRRLNEAREKFNTPMYITSGYRCDKHNQEVGSISTNHTSGQAVDIYCKGSGQRWFMVKALMDAGMLGIGIHKTFIHADTNRDFSKMWLYEPTKL